ncbi:hypothetical protein I4U23_022897 [Adineta vaga]|nr:hypothetical protein I4U23_022897 [Adineta vaga]
MYTSGYFIIHGFTRFEHLSNDVLYEIFDYLDFLDVHNICSDLNIRFQTLVNSSTIPIKLNLSFESSLIFQRHWQNITLLNQYRIQSLRLTKPSVSIIAHSPISIWSQFTRLENVIFFNIESLYIGSVFLRLNHVPCLISLTIDCCDRNVDNKIIYQCLLRLPQLKYCQFSSQSTRHYKPLPLATIKFSPIESLVIEHCLTTTEIHAILSYTPQLRRLSIQCDDVSQYTSIDLSPLMLNRLTHLSLKINLVPLEYLESMMKNLFNYVQVLHISTEKTVSLLNGKFWEELIKSHLSYLRIFDIGIFYSCTSYDPAVSKRFDTWMEQFQSSFWTQRQWFFENYISRENHP